MMLAFVLPRYLSQFYMPLSSGLHLFCLSNVSFTSTQLININRGCLREDLPPSSLATNGQISIAIVNKDEQWLQKHLVRCGDTAISLSIYNIMIFLYVSY